ncbi:hypothetical protein QYE76_013631 [Lolium multiflorum]|uniref:CCHC-type domain-containing protein n=1 Tax=Lolium multiflorum TaxID=4521 RepID=A0AAD8X7U2_LOLMU|nr:hypothetical protein QYE76_013631 [Lolium multiflorum]
MDSSSSSASSGFSSLSSSSREPTPEWGSLAAHDVLAPTTWDKEDHDSSVWSEDDKSLTDGEDDFQFLIDGELEAESEDDRFSWDGFTSSNEGEEEEDETSSDEYPPAKRFRAGSDDDDDDEEEEAPAEGYGSSDEELAGSSADGSSDGDDEGSDGHRLGTTSIGLQQDGPEPVHDDGSPFRFLPPAPVVLFCKNSPPLKKVVMQSQPMTPKSASKSRVSSGPAAPEPQSRREQKRKVAARKTLKRQSPTPPRKFARYDLSRLLTFDPESIEPATAKASKESGPSTHGQLQHLKALLSSSIETLVEDSEEVKSILEDIHHLPTLQVKLGQTRLYSASNELWRIILEGFKPYNPDKLTRREAVDSQLNNTALHMIQTSVGTKELHLVRNYTTAKEAWDGLSASCIGSESTRRNKYNALKNKAEGFLRLPDEDHELMYGRLLTVADAFRLIGATHINDSWIKEKYIECMMPFVPIDVKTLVGRECYSSLTSQQVVHEMQALKVLKENSHDSRNRALGMTKGSNLALAVNSVEEVFPQESYRASWSMSYPEDLEHHYHDHMAFHANSFWVDPSKAKEDNIKRNNSRGSTNSGPRTRSCYNCNDKRHFIAECPYENRETHGGRLIPKDKSKVSKDKYSKAPKKKFYNNKTKKGKRPSKIVLVTREEYSSDEVGSSSSEEDEESSKELAAIVTTNIPSSSLFESPNELAKASSPQSKLSLDDLLSKQRSNNGKEGLGYNAKAKKANKQKAKPAQEKKKAVTNGEASKGKTMNDDDAEIANPHYVLFKDYYGDVYAKYVGPYDGYVSWSIWVPKTLVANKR